MTIEAHSEKSVSAPHASDWALSHGITALSTAQLSKLLAVPTVQVSERLFVPKKRGEWITPAKGLWIPVPVEFRAWGGPPANEFVDALMNHFDADYYVGWLSAAALHGASHHSPQITDIAVSKMVRSRQAGRSRLNFHVRQDLSKLPIEERQNRSGVFRVSSPEVTAMDLALDLRLAGGIDNAITVIRDLAEESLLDDEALTQLMPLFPVVAARRVGYIVETYTDRTLDALAASITTASQNPSRLHPDHPLTGTLDRRWGLRVNVGVEVE